jgi:hypothetical protein
VSDGHRHEEDARESSQRLVRATRAFGEVEASAGLSAFGACAVRSAMYGRPLHGY